jgi:hypothetical protein
VSDAEIDALMAPVISWLEQFVKPRVRIDEEQKEKPHEKQKTRPQERQINKEKYPRLNEKEYMESVHANPHYSVTRHGQTLGLSSYMMDKLKKSLIEKGLIEEFSINLGKEFGGTVKFLELTNAGHKILGKKPKDKPARQCSQEHWWWQRQIHTYYANKGYRSESEMLRGSKRADVGVIHNCKTLAIEVELSAKNVVANVKEDLANGFDSVRVACRDAAVKQEAEKALHSWQGYAALEEKIEVCLLSDFGFIKGLKKS